MGQPHCSPSNHPHSKLPTQRDPALRTWLMWWIRKPRACDTDSVLFCAYRVERLPMSSLGIILSLITRSPIISSANCYRSELAKVVLTKRKLLKAYDSSYRFPPVFHEWFLKTFPEPSAWLAARLAYGRTYAVMSIVGFVLGFVLFSLRFLVWCFSLSSETLCRLGDRHGENTLYDQNSGDAVHVDLNCLFEKVKQTPLTVPR